MPTVTIKRLLLSSLLYSTAHAWVALTHLHAPIDNDKFLPPQPHPSEPDARWVPIATLAPLTSPISTPTPTPSSDEYNILPMLDPFSPPDLRKRQGAPAAVGGAAAQPTAADQISPVTTYLANSIVAGSPVQVPVVYTQTFVAVPDQWSSAGAGSIGLGTIVGTVGVVRSKRGLESEPTQAAVVSDRLEDLKTPQTWSA